MRPLVTITGEKEFNEIFFTDVRVPVDCTLGPVNEGWRVAMTTLAYERGTVAKLHLGTAGEDRAAHRRGRSARRSATAASPPTIRCCASSSRRVYLEGELLKLISERALSAELHGRAMGPEGSIAKLVWSEAEQHLAEVAGDVLGPDALDGLVGARPRLQPGAHDRGRHHPGEQEHPRPAHPRPPRAANSAGESDGVSRSASGSVSPGASGKWHATNWPGATSRICGSSSAHFVLRLRAARAEPAAARRRDRRRDLAERPWRALRAARSGREPGSRRAAPACTGARAAGR